MWARRCAEESGQAGLESALLLGALAAGALALGLPLLGKLLAAWEQHGSAVQAVIDLPLP